MPFLANDVDLFTKIVFHVLIISFRKLFMHPVVTRPSRYYSTTCLTLPSIDTPSLYACFMH